jgi:class 3 adenylate cyclase
MNAREARPAVKRKIAAILAADIAGYSRLVAEDEEETLRDRKSVV